MTSASMYPSSSTRDGFGTALKDLGSTNPDLVAVSADLTESMRMHWFQDAFPERFVQVGVAEQNLVGVAAGLALGGKIPVAGSYAAFSPTNSWGVIRTSIAYSATRVILVGGHAGVSIGEDGATHQALEDIALMRVLPNMTVVVPADAKQAAYALTALTKINGPSYLRITKYDAGPVPHPTPFIVGKAQVLARPAAVTIVACGTMVQTALKVRELLEKNAIDTGIINLHTIKPLDTNTLDVAMQAGKLLVTLEEHQRAGGMGSAVAEYVSSSTNARPSVLRIGVDDRFGESGSPTAVLDAFDLTAPKVFAEILQQWRRITQR